MAESPGQGPPLPAPLTAPLAPHRSPRDPQSGPCGRGLCKAVLGAASPLASLHSPPPLEGPSHGQAAAAAQGHSGGHARHPVALAPSELPAAHDPSRSLKAQRATGKYGLFMGFTEQPLSKQGQKPRRVCGGRSAPRRAGSPRPRPFMGGRHPAASALGRAQHWGVTDSSVNSHEHPEKTSLKAECSAPPRGSGPRCSL